MAPVGRVAVLKETNSSCTGSCTDTPLGYQQFRLRQIRIIGGDQPIAEIDAADNCC